MASKSSKGKLLPKYVKRVCGENYSGQRDPLYSASSTGRVYGKSHAYDCLHNLRLDYPQTSVGIPTTVQRTLRYFEKLLNLTGE
jgi:hypothetical protein